MSIRMTIRKVKLGLVFPFVVLLFSACTSVPKPAAPGSTLLVIYSVVDQAETDFRGLNFWLYLNDDSKRHIGFSRDENYTFITDLVPGIIETKFLQLSLSSRYTSQSGKREWNYPMRVIHEIIPGTYTVLPVKFIYREEKIGQGKIEFYIDFVKLSPQDMNKIRHELEEMGLTDYWRAAD